MLHDESLTVYSQNTLIDQRHDFQSHGRKRSRVIFKIPGISTPGFRMPSLISSLPSIRPIFEHMALSHNFSNFPLLISFNLLSFSIITMPRLVYFDMPLIDPGLSPDFNIRMGSIVCCDAVPLKFVTKCALAMKSTRLAHPTPNSASSFGKFASAEEVSVKPSFREIV